MSGTASFFVVEDARLASLVADAVPTPGGWLRRARDAFPEALRASSRQLEPFTEASGWVFNTLDLYLSSRHHVRYETFGDPTVTTALSRARGSAWLSLPHEHAARLLAALSGITIDQAALVSLIESEHAGEHSSEHAAGVEAAFRKLQSWLFQVPAGVTGLLSVG